jgi:hypothetical protein
MLFGMTHTFKSGSWLGYAALTCAALLFLATQLHPGSVPMLVALISLPVFGIYCGARGLFSGTWFNRICAGLSMVCFIWMFYYFLNG